mgnify:FL=1
MNYGLILDPIEEVIKQAKKYLGEQEVPKLSNRSLKIDYWLVEAGVPVGNPWCAAFITMMGRQALGTAWPVTNTASVQRMVDWAKTLIAAGVWVDTPQKGDLFVLYFDSLSRYGHVGLVTEVLNNGSFKTIEGNTNSDGSRDGYGVFEREHKQNAKTKYIRWIQTLPSKERIYSLLS